MEQKLEQMLAFAPLKQAKTVDQYVTGTAALFTPAPAPFGGYGPAFTPGCDIRPGYGPNIIPYGGLTGLGGDVHDTFKVDRYDNIFGGHTTFNVPGFRKYHVDWQGDD